ncbi:vomeronasal 1 receptor monDomV1R1283 [Monodelphis domestica]|uniref:Vomeronasal type-1 receptor n=2 Tax=Monodelphis domestica TaxID=13616 RepID=F7GES5_MONDO|nr:vomeronasal 1 receptor monDomV1R1283 [Monodelphis domestica]
MNLHESSLTLAFCMQIAIGVLGNSFLICLFTVTVLSGQRMRPIDMILNQIAWANSSMIISKSIPQTLVAMNLKNFLNVYGCKFFFYLHRVSRGLSLSMTCLLSSLQAITISSRSSRWAEFRDKIPQYMIPTCSLSWAFHLLLNSIVLEKVKGPRKSRNISNVLPYGYCSTSEATTVSTTLFIVVVSFPDVVCVWIMVFTSGYMVWLLYKHHKEVQHIHMANLSPRSSPEISATQSILLLVSTFVSFYSSNSILAAYIHLRKPGLWLVHSSTFLAACFPTVSPFVLLSTDSQLQKYSALFWRRNKPRFLPFSESLVPNQESDSLISSLLVE